MAIGKQLSTLLVNKPGTLAKLCSALKRNRVNIIAISIENMVDSCVAHLVTDNPKKATRAIEKIGLPVVTNSVVLKTLPDRPGALAEASRKLTSAGINIEYVYGSAGTGRGAGIIVFRVSDAKQANRVLR